MNDIQIVQGNESDARLVANLYDTLNDELERGVNYPGWRKNIYPTKDTAIEGIKEGTLFVAKLDKDIVGTIILNNDQPAAYKSLTWSISANNEEVIVIHTLAVHPKYLRYGIARKLLEFANIYAKTKGVSTIRLDVYINNTPAIKLYESCGYRFIGNVDLGLSQYGLELFKCYDKIIIEEPNL